MGEARLRRVQTLTLVVADLDVTEREELESLVEEARELGGYLHIEIRKIEKSE